MHDPTRDAVAEELRELHEHDEQQHDDAHHEGSDRHALLVEHQTRPLFGFFQALTLPLGIYGNESDFTDYRVSSEGLRERIDLSIGRASPLITYQLRSALPAGG